MKQDEDKNFGVGEIALKIEWHLLCLMPAGLSFMNI